jgi:antitoxin (DNA-binding transcriptional repressor) of toxin-antitoxin stability system
MQHVSIKQAKMSLTSLVAAALNGEEIVIEEEEQAVKLVPFQITKPHPIFGSAKGLIEIRDNFDHPILSDRNASGSLARTRSVRNML